MAEPNPEELFDRGKGIFNFAVNGGGGEFRPDSLETKKYYIQAKEYFEKACELDDAAGCVILLTRDKLVNKQEVFQYFSKACDLNNDYGCSTLGAMQYQGKVVVKNEKQAMEKFEKACKLGFKEVCEMVTYKGLCELGHKEACEIFSLEVLCRLSDLKACGMSSDKRKALGF
ncbi:sel1 repeat family protein [Helicobacter pylori]|uniref:tetratricopeptide repeat protein n=1 Tax=Helicobacter pylori TaxID=210 RepID=UPI001FD667A2|nr:tetratricopeptide repeat protein [Helicobacter pylori]UOR93966.1 sel1 repeat family protein [Helicobacter pylori]